MRRKIENRTKFADLARLAAAGLVLLALAACGNDGSEAQGSPTAPPGMFSTLPTTEPPAAGDQPPTIELNTPEPTLTPEPTPTPNPTYTPADADAPAVSHSGTHARPDGYSSAATGSHARADSDAESHGDARADGHARADGNPSTDLHSSANIYSGATAHLHTVPDVYAETDGRTNSRTDTSSNYVAHARAIGQHRILV